MDRSVIKLEIPESLVTDEMIHESAESDWTDSAPCNSGTNPENATKLKHKCLIDNPVDLGMNDKMGNSFIEPSSTMISNVHVLVIAPQEDNFGKCELLQANNNSYSPDHQIDINQDPTVPAVKQEMVDIVIKVEKTEEVSEDEIYCTQVKGEIQKCEEHIKLEDDINCPSIDNLNEMVKTEAQPDVMKNEISQDRLQEDLIKSESLLEENIQPSSCAPDMPDLLTEGMGIIMTETGVWSTRFLPKGTKFRPYDHSAFSSHETLNKTEV